jgi:hypothetical protein
MSGVDFDCGRQMCVESDPGTTGSHHSAAAGRAVEHAHMRPGPDAHLGESASNRWIGGHRTYGGLAMNPVQ